MKRAEKLGEVTINGKQVSFFSPPHDEPDFPWVDVYELARAFTPKHRAKRIVEQTKRFSKGPSAVRAAKNGSSVTLIMCHAMAHGLMMALDFEAGHRGDDEEGPAFIEYSRKAGVFFADNFKMSIEEIVHAFNNPGGPIMRAAEV